MSPILFATIGDPTNYQMVKYSIQGKEKESKISFLALKELLASQMKTVAIIGISTAATLQCDCNDYQSCSECIIKKAKEDHGVIADEYIVAPNIYKNFKSKPDYYLSYVYYKSLKILEREKPDEVYLDTTHGVNYMPILGKDALLLATSAYSARHEKSVAFKMYNSDPVIKGIAGPYELHVMESINITPLSGLKHVTTQILNREKNSFQSVRKIIDVDKLYKIARGLDNGLFVYFVDKSEEIEELMKKFDTDEEVKVDISEGKVITSRYKDVSYALAHALLYVSLRFKRDGECLDLGALEDLARKYTDAVTSTIIRNEIDNIGDVKENIKNERKLLRDVFGSQEGGFDKRILYAHGGLPYAGTYVYEYNGKICVSYGDKIGKIEEQM